MQRSQHEPVATQGHDNIGIGKITLPVDFEHGMQSGLSLIRRTGNEVYTAIFHHFIRDIINSLSSRRSGIYKCAQGTDSNRSCGVVHRLHAAHVIQYVNKSVNFLIMINRPAGNRVLPLSLFT